MSTPTYIPFSCTDQNETDMAATLKARGMTSHPWDAIRAFHNVIRSQKTMDEVCRGEHWTFTPLPGSPMPYVIYDHNNPAWAMIQEATAGLG